jgi:hypothetical protein
MSLARYNKFIESLKGQVIVGRKEVHHIVPKSLGGTNDSNNLIALTPRQHYIAHWMLWKIYGGKMAQAFWFMNTCKRYKKMNGRRYELLKEEYRKSVSGENGYWYGKKLPKEIIEKLSGENNPWYGKKHSEEAKKKMSETRKEYLKNEEVIENLRRHRANQIISKEAYERQAKVISSLVWMNDGKRSYRVKPELVNKKISEGLVHGRLMSFMDDKYKEQSRIRANEQWQKVKSTGHSGNLIKV